MNTCGPNCYAGIKILVSKVSTEFPFHKELSWVCSRTLYQAYDSQSGWNLTAHNGMVKKERACLKTQIRVRVGDDGCRQKKKSFVTRVVCRFSSFGHHLHSSTSPTVHDRTPRTLRPQNSKRGRSKSMISLKGTLNVSISRILSV